MSSPPPESPPDPPLPAPAPADTGPAPAARATEGPAGDGGAEAASAADVQATFAATLVDEWVRDGLTDAVVCPGSRSTPLAIALAARSGLRLHVHHDERSGAFLALGLGLSTGRAALVLTTSGTAAAELHPAVVEADLAGVPLLVCTADRPPELRDVGAPQAIDQVHLYGRSVRWYGDPGVPDASGRDRWRPFAARAYAVTGGARPGPVHLNLPFREPLVGTAGPLPPPRGDGAWVRATAAPGEAEGDAAARRGEPVPADLVALATELVGRRGVLIAGGVDVDGAALHATAGDLGWPVIADPRSPAWMAAPTLVLHADALVRSPAAAARLRPEVVVRLGAPGSSRVVNEWLTASGAREIVAGATAWSDPAATAELVIDVPADVLLAALATAAAPRPPGTGQGMWLAHWRAAADAARAAVEATFADADADADAGVDADADGGLPLHNEPAVARAVVRAVPAGGRLVVSASMPIRDVERYADAPPGMPVRALTVHANRGANGIDGVVSTAVGVAAGSDAPTAVLIGDVAFLHDSNGLLGAADRAIDLVCVVVDNDGGGIFSFLPQARLLPADRFETLFGTPHGLDLAALAAAYGVPARRLGSAEDVAAAVVGAFAQGGVHVLVVGTDRAANADVHRRIDDAVATAVDAVLAGGDST